MVALPSQKAGESRIFVHDVNIETRILFETAGGVGATSIRELFGRAQLGPILSPAKNSWAGSATLNELAEINACERANHLFPGRAYPTRAAESTYLRLSTASRDLGVTVRIRSCHALFSALRARLIATANGNGYSIKASSMGPPVIRKAAPGGRVELLVYVEQLKPGDRFGGRQVASLDSSGTPLRASISTARAPWERVIIFDDGTSITRETRAKIRISRSD